VKDFHSSLSAHFYDMNHTTFDKTIARLRAAFDAPLPGLAAAMEMAPQHRGHMGVAAARLQGCREGAVMILLYPSDGQIYTVLTVRSSTLRTHSGQISLPGGRVDPGESEADTARRETEEELGIPSASVEVLGVLTQVYIPPSNFCLTPVVGALAERPEFRPNAAEVAAVIEVPVYMLVGTTNRYAEERIIEGIARRIPYFLYNDHKIWGATAIILAEFAALWQGTIG
jgi:8-oxo-dGTP pyrophosphatase MutT (NUDIX family)